MSFTVAKSLLFAQKTVNYTSITDSNNTAENGKLHKILLNTYKELNF